MILIYNLELPYFLSNVCGLLRCGNAGNLTSVPLLHPPAQPGVPSFTCVLSSLDWLFPPPTHTSACLFIILLLKLLRQ